MSANLLLQNSMSCCTAAGKFLFELYVPVCLFADLLLTSVTISQACWWHSMPLVTQKWELVVFAQHELPLLWTGLFWLSSITLWKSEHEGEQQRGSWLAVCLGEGSPLLAWRLNCISSLGEGDTCRSRGKMAEKAEGRTSDLHCMLNLWL